jgi:hypothetical protein
MSERMTRVPKKIESGLVVALAMLAMPSGAFGEIVIGKSVDGVSLSATRQQVKHRLGKPTTVEKPVPRVTLWNYLHGYKALNVQVSFDHGRVNSLSVYDGQSTSKGIHVGSSLSALERAYPDAQCTSGNGPGESPDSELCDLRSKYHGHKVETDFEFADVHQGVEEISLGYL